VVLLTEWNEYRDLDFSKLKESMRSAAFVDCRNIYDPREVRKFGFAHTAVGRSFESAAPWAMEDVVIREESSDTISRPATLEKH
jgi:UDPglucose 6-dehydrogenase